MSKAGNRGRALRRSLRKSSLDRASAALRSLFWGAIASGALITLLLGSFGKRGLGPEAFPNSAAPAQGGK